MSVFRNLHPEITENFDQSVNIMNIGNVFYPYFFVGK